MKGQVPLGLVLLKAGSPIQPEALEKELVEMVRAKLGAIACFKQAVVVRRLPKTRSGKILRKIINDKELEIKRIRNERSVVIPFSYSILRVQK